MGEQLGELLDGTWWRVAVNYLVPFVVASVGYRQRARPYSDLASPGEHAP